MIVACPQFFSLPAPSSYSSSFSSSLSAPLCDAIVTTEIGVNPRYVYAHLQLEKKNMILPREK